MPWHPPGPPAASRAAFLFCMPLPLIAAALLAAFGATELGIIAILVLAEALAWFGATAEVALQRYSRSELLEQVPEGDARDALTERLARTPTDELTARLMRYLGNALLVLGLGYLVFGRGVEALSWQAATAVVAGAFALTFLINDVLARIVAERAPERVLTRALKPLSVLAILTAPLRAPLRWIVRVLFRVRLEEDALTARDEVLESLEEGEREGSFSSEEAEMIGGIIDLQTQAVSSVMTPRSDMIMVPEETTLAEAVALVVEEGYSRIPVLREDRDDVVGLLYARDLLTRRRPGEDEEVPEDATVRDLMREPYFVPEGKSVGDLLQEMRARKVHLAVVLDEHTRVAGLVTIEDLLEEIVGEIEDEYDEPDEDDETSGLQALGDGRLRLDGRTPIEDVNRALRVELPVTDDCETMGGLMFHQLGKVPIAGDVVELEEVAIRVLEADERKARSLVVERRA